MKFIYFVIPLIAACGIGLDAHETDTDYATQERGRALIHPSKPGTPRRRYRRHIKWGLDGDVETTATRTYKDARCRRPSGGHRTRHWF